jgi:hypothetical protein
MNYLYGIGIIVVAFLLGTWWWRRNYKPSPLEVHFQDLQNRQQVGNLAQQASWMCRPQVAMLGEGWATTCRINPTNTQSTTHNAPGKTRNNFRFLQPGQ